jgi:hypothetical protein
VNLTIVLHLANSSALFSLHAKAITSGMVQRYDVRHGVWTVSYLGWVRSLGLLSPASRHPAPCNVLMIAAHFVWGTVIAGATDYTLKGRTKSVMNRNDASEHRSDRVVSCTTQPHRRRKANFIAAEDVPWDTTPTVTISSTIPLTVRNGRLSKVAHVSSVPRIV